MRARTLLPTLLAISGTAHADVDWAKGLVIAEGIGVANRAAPTPAAARGPARRLAEEAAKKKLATQVLGLALADGGVTKTSPAIDRAVANAIVITADPETDGSWRVTMAVPIEALRVALAGPRTLGSDDGPPVVIVEGANAKPAIGYKLGALAASTVFVKEIPAWAKDAPRIKAKGTKAGVIDVEVGKATASTLFVVVGK